MSTLPLVLKIEDFRDLEHWRWVLSDANGKFLTDHEVSVSAVDTNYKGYFDLSSHLRQYAAPDKWPGDEERVLKELGQWINQHLLGTIATRILDYGPPLTVRVVAPPVAARIVYGPIELAFARNASLALQGVTFVFESSGPRKVDSKEKIKEKLRVLALFSLPEDASVLGLRRERFELQRKLRVLGQLHDAAIELRVVQYGSTREMLREVIEDGEGWDIIHLSGHGEKAIFVLEKEDGSEDPIGPGDLVELLALTGRRVKLMTLASCSSGAAVIEETMNWLGLSAPASPAPVPNQVERVTALGMTIAEKLDCAVVAMRYPVQDEFAIRFGGLLYEKLLGKRQPLDRVLSLALTSVLKLGFRPGLPPISMATPCLFGERAVDLSFQLPKNNPDDMVPEDNGLAYFEPEPEHFVGRGAAMSRANVVLAPSSGKTAVLFYGMPGAGKTACALELTYRHEVRRFQRFVWYKAPEAGAVIENEILNLALNMERSIPNFKMVHVVDKEPAFSNWLPNCGRFLEQRSILIVLDNIESLLTSAGEWRDPRWAKLVNVMVSHRGISRLVMTSRTAPSSLRNDPRVQIESVNALSFRESILLAHELPNLGALLRGEK